MLQTPIRSLLFIIITVFITSCGNKKPREETTTQATGFDGPLKYIPIDDAEQFDESWSKENIIVYHTISEPDNLHPTNGTSAMRNEIFQYIHRTLVHLDYRTLKITTGLLDSLPVMEGNGKVE